MQATPQAILNGGLTFLWLELTSKCNLNCVHCYADSGPTAPSGKLTAAQYFDLIADSARLGCGGVQFIGGEPTLHPALPELIAHARTSGLEAVEVYTNARRLPNNLLECLGRNRVDVAVSFYSCDASIHDAVTQVPGSHRSTVQNLRRLIEANIAVRVGIIEMESNAQTIPGTIDFLRDLGVRNIGTDKVRAFGRGAILSRANQPNLMGLCGSCWQGTLCIDPSGKASACIMSKHWPVGSIPEMTLEGKRPINTASQGLRDTASWEYEATASRSSRVVAANHFRA